MHKLLKGLIKTIFTQHQDLIATPAENSRVWLRRIALGFSLQKEPYLWNADEWAKIVSEDLPDFFRCSPEAESIWNGGFKKYYPEDIQQDIDSIIQNSKNG